MRIIAGKWGGQSFQGKSLPKQRPTSDKVREAIFNLLTARLGDDWSDLRVLDLFAGTGALGLEALSRGAASATFVDSHFGATKNLRELLRDFGVEAPAEVICTGVIDAIRGFQKKQSTFDLIFLDPPYREDWVAPTLRHIQEAGILSSRGLVIAEHDKREPLIGLESLWKTEDSRRYGDTVVSLLKPL